MEEYGRKLLESLVARRVLKTGVARDILQWSLQEEKSPEPPLLEQGLVTRDVLLQAKATLLGVEGVNLQSATLDPATASILPHAMALRYRAVCLRVQGEEMVLAMDDPSDAFAISYIKMRTGFEVQVRAALAPDVDDAIEKVYSHSPTPGVAPESMRRRIGQEAVRARTVHVARDEDVPETPTGRTAMPRLSLRPGTVVPPPAARPQPATTGPRVRLGTAEVSDRDRRLAILARVSTSLVTILDEDTLIDRILDTAVSLFTADAASLILIDWESMELFFREARGPVKNQVLNARLSLDEENSIAAWAVKRRQSVNVPDVSCDPRHNKQADEAFGYVTRSLVAVPLLHGNDVLGVLELLNKQGGPFDDADVSDLEILAAQASVCLANTMTVRQLHNFYHQAVETIIELYQAFDPVSHQHVFDVARLATAIGQELGLGDTDMETLCYASLLHDIGKARCADPEDPQHAVLGAQTLAHITLFGRLAPAVRHHHERYDGSGTPDGLAGEDIPLLSRIMTVADVWHEDAARGATPDVEAFCARFGSEFDPAMEIAFRRAVAVS